MGRKTTYNGRFIVPEEPKSGSKWLVGGLLAIPFWSVPGFGVAVLAGSICCFVKAGKMNSKRSMYRRFHEFCAVIGLRERVPVRELAKISEMGKSDMRRYLQRMIAEGYFGEGAYLDVYHDELILPPVPGHEQPRSRVDDWKNMVIDWKDMVFDLLDALRGEKISREPVRDAQYSSVRKPEKKAARPPETAQQAEPKSQPKPAPERKKSHADELERNLNELYNLNEKIEDEAVSRRIDRIGTLTAGIFRAVIDNPGREQDVRKFMNYYLPTTLKLLHSYEMLEEQSYQGENIVASRKKIESVLDMLIQAFEKQLDRLFKNDALDIATDIDVLETMMAGDGLSQKGQMGMR